MRSVNYRLCLTNRSERELLGLYLVLDEPYCPFSWFIFYQFYLSICLRCFFVRIMVCKSRGYIHNALWRVMNLCDLILNWCGKCLKPSIRTHGWENVSQCNVLYGHSLYLKTLLVSLCDQISHAERYYS